MTSTTLLSAAQVATANAALVDSEWVQQTLGELVLRALEALGAQGFTSPAKVPRCTSTEFDGEAHALSYLPLSTGEGSDQLTLRAALVVGSDPELMGRARLQLDILRPLLGGVNQHPRERLVVTAWLYVSPPADGELHEMDRPQALENHFRECFEAEGRADLDAGIASFLAEVEAELSL